MTATSVVDAPGWGDAGAARAYADFERTHGWYAGLGRDLAARAPLERARLVVDLCAGTGATTRAALARLGQGAQVLAVDSSRAMLVEGERTVDDGRVQWAQVPAEACGQLAPGRADVVLCSAALWDTDLPAVLAGVRALLRPGGHFVFNLSPVAYLPTGDEVRRAPSSATTRRTPGLWDVMAALAVLTFDHVPAPVLPRRPRLTRDSLCRALVDAGLQARSLAVVEYEMDPRTMHAWLSLPMFLPSFPPLTSQQCRQLLDRAHERVDPGAVLRSPWLVVRASTAAATTVPGSSLASPPATCHDGKYLRSLPVVPGTTDQGGRHVGSP